MGSSSSHFSDVGFTISGPLLFGKYGSSLWTNLSAPLCVVYHLCDAAAEIYSPSLNSTGTSLNQACPEPISHHLHHKSAAQYRSPISVKVTTIHSNVQTKKPGNTWAHRQPISQGDQVLSTLPSKHALNPITYARWSKTVGFELCPCKFLALGFLICPME